MLLFDIIGFKIQLNGWVTYCIYQTFANTNIVQINIIIKFIMKRISNQTNHHHHHIRSPTHNSNFKILTPTIKLRTLFHDYCQDNNSQYAISMKKGFIVNLNSLPGVNDMNNQIWKLQSKQDGGCQVSNGGLINTNIRRAQNSLFSNLISKLSTKQNKQKSKIKSHCNPIDDKPHVSKSPLRRTKNPDTNSYRNIKNNIMGNILQARNISPKQQNSNLPLDSNARTSKNQSHQSSKIQESNNIKLNPHLNNVINIQNIECISSQYGSNIKQSNPGLTNNTLQTQNINPSGSKNNSHTSYNIINKLPPTYPHPNPHQKNLNNIQILQNKNEADIENTDQNKMPTQTQSYNVQFSFQNAHNFQPVYSAHPKIYSGESFNLALQNFKNQPPKECKQSGINANVRLNKNKESIIESLINYQKQQKPEQNKVELKQIVQQQKKESTLQNVKAVEKEIKPDSGLKSKELPIPISIDINLSNRQSQNEEVYQNVKNPYVSSQHQSNIFKEKQAVNPPSNRKIQNQQEKKEDNKQASKKLTDEQVCQIISSKKRSAIANNVPVVKNQQKQLLNMSDLDIDVLLKIEQPVQNNVQVKTESNYPVAKDNSDNGSKIKEENMIKRIVLNVSEKNQSKLNHLQIPKTITFPEITQPSPIITIKKPSISPMVINSSIPLTIPQNPQMNRYNIEPLALKTSFVPHYHLNQLTPSVSSPRAFQNSNNNSNRFSNGFQKGMNQGSKPTQSVYEVNRLSEPSQQKSSLLFELSANSNL